MSFSKYEYLLSIIVPIYRVELYLPQCIESVLSQNYQDFELILVDDGSPDNCADICDEYARKDNRIKVIHKTNGGLVSARKAGLQLAKGKYIGYVDGDDWVDPEFYENMMKVACQSDTDIVAAGFIKDIGDNCSIKTNVLPCGLYTKERVAAEVIPSMMFDTDYAEPGLFTYVWNKVFKRSVLYQIQMDVPDGISLGEDAACVYPAVLKANTICITDDCYYHYRQRADSMLKISDNYREDYVGYQTLYAFLKDRFENITQLKESLDSFLIYLITTRCGGVDVNNGNTDWYLYEKKPFATKIAVYGAGTLGQHFVKRISRSEEYFVVKWVDEDYEILRNHGLDVDSPDSVCDRDFDSIIITFLDRKSAEDIKKRLLKTGIPEDKIILSDFPGMDRKAVLKRFGIV